MQQKLRGNPPTPLHHRGDHDLVIRAIARHRRLKEHGDDAGAAQALAQAQAALEAHLATVRSAARR